MIEFKNDIELTLIREFNEPADEVSSEENETFKAGEPVNACIISRNGEYVDLEFDDGAVSLGVHTSCFVELREHVFNPITNLCKFCGCHAYDDAVVSEPCIAK